MIIFDEIHILILNQGSHRRDKLFAKSWAGSEAGGRRRVQNGGERGKEEHRSGSDKLNRVFRV